MTSGADISACGTYRYRLWRYWSDGKPEVVWVMLNPSIADASTDDHTIRKCIGFSQRWGYGAIIVVNLFALRATNPKELLKHKDPIGPENNVFLFDAIRAAQKVVVAWGAHGWLHDRGGFVRDQAQRNRIELHHLGLTKEGYPRHPLRLAYDTKPQPWESWR